MTTTNNKLDNDTVRRLSKLISGSKSSTNSTPIMTGTVVQNDNSLYVAVDDDTLVPISDTSATVNVGDKVTIALDDETALIVGNNTDKSVATTNLTKTENGLKLDIEGKASKAELRLESDKLQSSITDTKKELNSTITQTAKDIRSEVKAGDDALGTQITQTADGLTVKITNAQDTADTAKTNAATAQTTANTAKTNAATAQSTADAAKTAAATAQTSADDAKKVATNYLSFNSTDGLVVGDMTASTLKNNTQITSSGFNIRNGSNVLASFEDDEIALGKNSQTAVISLCGNSGEIKNYEEGGLFISANTSQEQNGSTIFLEPSMFVNEDSKIRTNIQISSNYVRLASVEEGDTINRWGDVSVSPTEVKISASDVNGFVSRLKVDNEGCFIAHSGEYTKVYGETVLYSSDTGTTSTVTLSESATNFTYLEIYYTRLGSFTKSVKVHNANGKTVNLTDFYKLNDTTYQSQTEDAKISGTTITRGKRFYANFVIDSTAVSNGVTDTPLFAITRVVGIK